MPQQLRTCPESLFWYWISERHRIFLNRLKGKPKPWSEDPIFQTYKFVNVFRDLDRTTAWLVENFLVPHRNDDRSLLAFNICWFRMFNRWETGQLLGWQTDWRKNMVAEVLRRADFPVFTGAYIIHSDHGREKIASIVDVCENLYHMCLAAGAFEEFLKRENSMECTWLHLQDIFHVGEFMAYQMVLDMMYTDKLLGNAVDKDTWACTGPGAMRGLRRLNPETTPKTSLEAMADLTWRAPMALAEIGAFHVPKMSIHDIEFCLCELDKYCRVLYGEGRPRSKYPGGA